MAQAAQTRSWQSLKGIARSWSKRRFRGVLPALLVVLVVLPTATAASEPPSDFDAAAHATTEAENSALRFREAMGFSTDLSVVRAAASKEAAQPSEFGVLL